MLVMPEEEIDYDLLNNISNGFGLHKIVLNAEGKPIDYIFLQVNPAFEKYTGLKNVIGKKVTEILPGIEKDPSDWIGKLGKVAVECNTLDFESYSEPLKKTFKCHAYCPKKGYFAVVFEDVSQKRKDEKTMKEKIENLETFQSFSVGRELKMVELKREINKLCEKLGEKHRY